MHAQRGSILPLVSIGLLAIFGMAALGLDVGVVFWDKARLQNATDSAALSAAKVLDLTGGDTTASSAAGLQTFNINANGPGNEPLADAVSGGLVPTFQYSATLNPFVPGAAAGPYVRATAANFQRVGWFSQMFGNASLQVDATAVAGPSPTLEEVCDIAPVMACASPEAGSDPPVADLDDATDDGLHFGYTPGQEIVLKASGGNPGPSEGNYFLIRLGAPGADVVRNAFAGVYERCTSTSNLIDSEPGVEAGPVSQGVDTRFEPCRNPLDCDIDNDGNDDILPDLVVTEPMTYAAYQAAYNSSPPAYNNYPDHSPYGTAYRRIIKVPIANCTGMAPGATSVPLLDIACFFLKEPVAPGNAELVGEFITSGCQAVGVTGPNPSSGPGPFKIILYKDPNEVTS